MADRQTMENHSLKNSQTDSLIEEVSAGREVFWANPSYTTMEKAMAASQYTMEDVKDAEARLQRFASYIRIAFPETEESNGIIESTITRIPEMASFLEKRYNQEIAGELYLKRDDTLPIAGTIKARGAIYEVLKHAETLALEKGMLKSTEEDYAIFATEAFRTFFSKYHIAVGTTGNLGISVGTMGAKLGFHVTVHVSVDAKQWKKDFLRSRGVEVVEHQTNFTEAVEQGREASEADPTSYFVDDEHSEHLFLGYTVGGLRMKRQLEEAGITVDDDHPLFVYLPCGIGGSPGGVTFGMKQAFGDNVHCFFAEPTKMPSMLLGLSTHQYDGVTSADVGQGGLTVADGLAVPRTSSLVAKLMEPFFSGGYTVEEEEFKALLRAMHETEGIFLEPAALAGVPGAIRMLRSKEGKDYLAGHHLTDKLARATHIAWATGGSMVPESDRQEFLAEGKEALDKTDYH